MNITPEQVKSLNVLLKITALLFSASRASNRNTERKRLKLIKQIFQSILNRQEIKSIFACKTKDRLQRTLKETFNHEKIELIQRSNQYYAAMRNMLLQHFPGTKKKYPKASSGLDMLSLNIQLSIQAYNANRKNDDQIKHHDGSDDFYSLAIRAVDSQKETTSLLNHCATTSIVSATKKRKRDMEPLTHLVTYVGDRRTQLFKNSATAVKEMEIDNCKTFQPTKKSRISTNRVNTSNPIWYSYSAVCIATSYGDKNTTTK